jgi:hypothetical protein
MTLPNFLGIGARRSGTSWLDMLLRSHQDIYLPKQRKEVHFFNDYYDRGLNWYQRFFPSPDQASEYRAVGEITPGYLYHPDAPARIQGHIPDCRFIAILRNPVDRAYSQYAQSVRASNDLRSFEEYLDQEPDAFARGLYSEQLKRYLQYFPLDNFLILIFERTIKDPAQIRHQLADFLSVDASRFGYCDTERRVNASHQVRFARSYAMARRFGRYLQHKDAHWVVNTANVLGMGRIFGKHGALPPMNAKIRTELLSKYEADIATLEDILGEDLSLWKK